MSGKFAIEFIRDALDQIANFPVRDENQILAGIARQLTHQPHIETRNRKLLRPNGLAPWELRLGRFRIFYDVDIEEQTVIILAVGIKKRNKLFIAHEEVILENH
jgi:mRNA-degrading endonuclease RelE of RelBE toxin-antitoxin system